MNRNLWRVIGIALLATIALDVIKITVERHTARATHVELHRGIEGGD